MNSDSIAFHGTLQQLLEKVETGEMIPKLQASHAPMCKFFTAYYVISGIRHVVPLVHGPTGCPLSMSDFVRTREHSSIVLRTKRSKKVSMDWFRTKNRRKLRR
jgi:nitrogenase molybdenum-iron protein alpha/beta subunit